MEVARRRVGVAVLACLVPCAGLFVACGGGGQSAGDAKTAEATVDWRQIDPPAAAGSLAPNLAMAAGKPVLSWLEPVAGDGHRLLVASLEDESWTAPSMVAEGDRFFANWADLPAVAESGDGSLVAHWLAKTADETYAYSIFLARSVDGGASWSELGRLNDDDTPTEHGFVSYAVEGDGLRAFWLDGRQMPGGGAMSLRTALVGDAVGASELLDERVCDCCSTDAVVAGAAALVVYRDRGAEEVRDISRLRRVSGGWSEPSGVADDGWSIHGCPVNGPAVDAAGELAVVAWFTGADEARRVQIAFSRDGGASFGPPTVVDALSPPGRVDVVLDGAGGAVVSWLAQAGETGVVRLRRVGADGAMGEPFDMAATGTARASGFPRLLRIAETLYLAWVDTAPGEGQRIRALGLPLKRLPAPQGTGHGPT